MPIRQPRRRNEKGRKVSGHTASATDVDSTTRQRLLINGVVQPGEAVGIVAQVAVTLAGFAGIVVVFRPDSVHQWSLLDQFRLRLLLTNSALPLADALFAIFLLTVDPAPVAIWRWCSAFSLATQIPFRISIGTAMRRLPVAERQSTNRLIYYSIGVIAAVALVLQVMNIISWNKFWPFFAGMFVNLIAAVVQFLRLVLLPHGPK